MAQGGMNAVKSPHNKEANEQASHSSKTLRKADPVNSSLVMSLSK